LGEKKPQYTSEQASRDRSKKITFYFKALAVFLNSAGLGAYCDCKRLKQLITTIANIKQQLLISD
jgi:nitrate reductase NapE component